MKAATLSQTLAVPSNFEITAKLHGLDPAHDATIKDFKAKNIADLKLHKNTKIAASKEQIELVHSKLREDLGLQEQLLNLHALELHLPGNMREDFLNMPSHSPLLGYLSTLNASFVPVLDYLICFKPELGLTLQRMTESYNLIVMAQYRGYFNSENAKTREYDEKIKYVDERIREVTQQKAEQEYKRELINTLIESKDTIIKELTVRIDALEAKDAEITEYIQSTRMNLDEPEERVRQEAQRIRD